METTEVLSKMRDIVHTVLPNAKVILFGSRANNTAHDESDWDLLVLHKTSIDYRLKSAVRDALFPLSLEMLSLIHSVVVNENEWQNNPGWYSLKLSISSNPVIEA